MKPQLLKRSTHLNCSFSLESHIYQNFLKVWHYHPELELVCILESTGSRFVGDSIEKFQAGEIVLIGKNLPHLWLNDKEYFEKGSSLKVNAVVIHFMENFVNHLLHIPELAAITDLFKTAERGIRFEGKANEPILKSIQKMFELDDLGKFIKVMELLKALAQHQQFKVLSSNGFIESFQEINSNKIVKVHEYIMNNFKKEISLEAAADLANMNSSAFSRYFKQVQKITFTQFVNEIRVGYACKLLIEQKYNIAEVCYESGFRNLSNFNRQFKELKKISPTEYVKVHATL